MQHPWTHRPHRHESRFWLVLWKVSQSISDRWDSGNLRQPPGLATAQGHSRRIRIPKLFLLGSPAQTLMLALLWCHRMPKGREGEGSFKSSIIKINILSSWIFAIKAVLYIQYISSTAGIWGAGVLSFLGRNKNLFRFFSFVWDKQEQTNKFLNTDLHTQRLCIAGSFIDSYPTHIIG